MVGLEKLKSEFWNGKYQEKDYCFDEEGIEIAVKRALSDFTDRTEKLKPGSGYKSFGVEEKFKVLCGTDGKEYNDPKDGSFVQKFIVFSRNRIIKTTQPKTRLMHGTRICAKNF